MILIVKLGALGDVLRTTSLLTPLRRKYKEPIYWLTSPEARPLLKGNPDIKGIFSHAQKISLRFDRVLSLEENKTAARCAQKVCCGQLTGVILKDGQLSYTPDSAPYYEMSLLNPNSARADELKAANKKTYAEIWLDLLGLPAPKNHEDIRPKLFLNAQDRVEAKNLLRQHLIQAGEAIGFNPGAGKRWPSKEIPIEKSRAILRALSRLKKPILLLGGKEEERRNKKIAKGFKNVFRPKSMPVRSFAGLIDLCSAIVTTDSLAFHIATALSKSAIVLIGPTSSAELDVYGHGEKLSSEKSCHCFYLKYCSQKNSCLNQISSLKIAQTVEQFITTHVTPAIRRPGSSVHKSLDSGLRRNDGHAPLEKFL